MITGKKLVISLSKNLLVLFVLLWQFSGALATIIVVNPDGSSNATINDAAASFGMSLEDMTMIGLVVDSNPDNWGCDPKSIPALPVIPPFNDSQANWFLVLLRGNCTFAQKAINAEAVGYRALIIRNELNKPDRASLICGEPFDCDNITIFVTMVSNSDGKDLAEEFNYLNQFSVSISGEPSESYLFYVLPFLVVVGVVLLVVSSFFVFRLIRDCRIARKARLSRWALRKIPTRKFKKGTDHYDCCSICLEDFVDGEKLRILPCDHAYHVKCIDPWLLNNRRNCPVCKRRVRVPGETQSDDEENGEAATNTTINNSTARGEAGELNEEEAAMPIGEGRQRVLSQSSDDAPLIRRANGLVCCLPRSHPSSDSLTGTPGTAPSAGSLPTVSSQLAGSQPTQIPSSARVEVFSSMSAPNNVQTEPVLTRNSDEQAETDTSSVSGSSDDDDEAFMSPEVATSESQVVIHVPPVGADDGENDEVNFSDDTTPTTNSGDPGAVYA